MIQPTKNILVTGAAGFIGSHIVRRLIRDGFHVSILVKPSSDLWRLEDVLSKVSCFHGDFLEGAGLYQTMKEIKPDGIFHLAASNIQSGWTAPDEEVVRTNFLGTINLLKALGDVDYHFFINTGSFLEYGPKDAPLKEPDACSPTELYSISKLAATLYSQTVAKSNRKPIITFRIFTPYGPFMQSGRLVYEVISCALKNKEINLTHPTITRDFIFINDLVDLYMESMSKAKEYAGEIFNAGSGETTSLRQVIDCILKNINSRSNINWGALPQVAYDSATWQADMTKTYAHFSWRPTYTFESGLIETIDWLRAKSN